MDMPTSPELVLLGGKWPGLLLYCVTSSDSPRAMLIFPYLLRAQTADEVALSNLACLGRASPKDSGFPEPSLPSLNGHLPTSMCYSCSYHQHCIRSQGSLSLLLDSDTSAESLPSLRELTNHISLGVTPSQDTGTPCSFLSICII